MLDHDEDHPLRRPAQLVPSRTEPKNFPSDGELFAELKRLYEALAAQIDLCSKAGLLVADCQIDANDFNTNPTPPIRTVKRHKLNVVRRFIG